MRPFDGTKLEYSYRPLDNINQFWAGPSYWKMRSKSRKITLGRPSLSDTESLSSQATSVDTHPIKRKATNRNKVEKVKFISVTSNIPDESSDYTDDDDDVFLSIGSKAAQKLKKNNVYKRWDSKRLKLPTDLHVDRNLFNYYEYCPSSVVHKDIADSVTPIGHDDDSDIEEVSY